MGYEDEKGFLKDVTGELTTGLEDEIDRLAKEYLAVLRTLAQESGDEQITNGFDEQFVSEFYTSLRDARVEADSEIVQELCAIIQEARECLPRMSRAAHSTPSDATVMNGTPFNFAPPSKAAENHEAVCKYCGGFLMMRWCQNQSCKRYDQKFRVLFKPTGTQ